ncbi:MAG: efflux RND transporter permease subunit [Planctomycetota bacterium]|nr:MAG: efflux RND transporter permease subunit [Planctomycetota bacterium]
MSAERESIPAEERRGLLATGVLRPVAMLMVILAAVVFGLVSLRKLPLDLLPEVDYPSLTVRTFYSGAAPADVEERVTDRLEDVLSTVRDLVRIRSSSRAEVSEILLEFEWGSNLPFLVQDVRERLDRVFLPEGVERPLILRYDPTLDPILRVALASTDPRRADLVRVRDVAEEEIERELEGMAGVAAVKVRGGLEDEIQVRVDPQKLAAFQIPPELVRQRLAEENLNVPGGKLEEGAVEYVVRTLNEFTSLEEIEQLPLVTRAGEPVKLGELASVTRTHKDRDVVLRVAGAEAVEIDIYREAGANIVEVADAVKARLLGTPAQQAYWRHGADAGAAGATAEGDDALVRERMGDFIAHKLPSDLKLTLLSDQSEFVRGAIGEVSDAALIGGLLAVVVCYLFLRRFAATLIIALSIPISVIATFGAMYLAGVSFNVMSLGGLALGIGMLVDGTIVVLESITRCREEGDPPFRAALRGTREVGGAVISAVLTTVVVFAPIVFVEGLAGQAFRDQALTVVASLMISLAVALFFVPGLAARVQLSARTQAKESVWRRLRRVLAPPPGGLLPRLRRPARLLEDYRRPRRLWLWLVVSALGAAGAVALVALGQKAMPAAVPEPAPAAPAGAGAPGDSGDAMAPYMLGALALALPLLWLVGQPLALILGRLLADAFGLGFYLARVLVGLTLALVAAVLYLPALAIQAVQRGLERAYPVLLRGALRAALPLLVLVIALSAVAWRAAGKLGRELLPEVLQGEITAELIFPAGSPLPETDLLAAALEARFRALPGVVESACVAGSDRESVSTEEEGPHTARITVRTAGGVHARRIEMQVEERMRALLSGEPELQRFNLRRPTLLALNAPLEVELQGEDLDELARSARMVAAQVAGMDGIEDLRSSVRRGNPEVRVTLDRERLAEHGLDLAEVAGRLRLAVEGEVSSTFPGRDERVDIRVRADLSQMQHVEQLRDLPVNPDAERPLPLGAVAQLSIADGPSEIRHLDGRRAAVLTATLGEFDLGGTSRALERELAELQLPPGVTATVGGQKKEMEQALSSLGLALALAIFLVYAVMAAQFESLLQPLLIMLTVPLAGIGVFLAMDATATPVSVVALLGLVILAGIVVDNAIVLFDRINHNRARGLSIEEAILEGGRTRLRPILMTTLTTVLGMLPMTGWFAEVPGLGSMGGAQGQELREPMALVVIAGIASSTVLTLIVMPVGYFLLERGLERWRGRGAG